MIEIVIQLRYDKELRNTFSPPNAYLVQSIEIYWINNKKFLLFARFFPSFPFYKYYYLGMW